VHASDEQLVAAKIDELRPTQLTVGFGEVALKRRQWIALTGEEKRRFIVEHPFPAVLGPNANYFIVDGHHLGRALFEERLDRAALSLIDDLSNLDPSEFWPLMESRGLVHPYDALGRRRDFDHMPNSLGELTDDPFRSLAARVRRAGGYAKDPTPFAEFHWADRLRDHIPFSALRTQPERAFICARKVVRAGVSSCGPRIGAKKSVVSEICPTVQNGLRLCDERGVACQNSC
jgi:hypothetical protein